MINELENRLDYDKKNTFLPVKPDPELIDELDMEINGRVLAKTKEINKDEI